MLSEVYKRCDVLHLSCRLPFTDDGAEDLTMPQKWLKLLAKGRNWPQVLQGSGTKLCTKLSCTSKLRCSQVSSLSKSRSHRFNVSFDPPVPHFLSSAVTFIFFWSFSNGQLFHYNGNKNSWHKRVEFCLFRVTVKSCTPELAGIEWTLLSGDMKKTSQRR